MPVGCRGLCLECGHQWDGLRRAVTCGHVDFQKPETYWSYSCPRCFVDLHVPRRLSRGAWMRWVSENASELTRAPLHFAACDLGVRVDHRALAVIARSPLLLRTCERVAGILAAAGSRYATVAIDIGTLECPDCGDPLLIGDLDANPSVCPGCESPSGSWTDDSGPEAVLVDYFPLEDGVVRRVILHLKELAEPPRKLNSERTPALPSVEVRGSLWDREMDGLLSTKEHHAELQAARRILP